MGDSRKKEYQLEYMQSKKWGKWTVTAFSHVGQDDLYFIKQGNYVKIGVTNDIDRRLKDLQSSNPNPLELLYSGIGEGKDEQLWHNVFAHRHHRGEWFKFGGCEI